ncbi:MAG: hypothetical protein WEC75_14620 [Dehalococcoidia bacterium]
MRTTQAAITTERAAQGPGVLVAIIGGYVLIGWTLDVEALKTALITLPLESMISREAEAEAA